MASKTTEQEARERIAKSKKLAGYSRIIFQDWPNWKEHMEWIATANEQEIEDWAEAIQDQEMADAANS